MERKRVRSDNYLQFFYEMTFDDEFWAQLSNSQNLTDTLNPYNENKEKIMQLRDQLKEETWKLIDSICTDKQKVVLHAYAEGKTQWEIAKMLGINQSSITKCLAGNVDYSNRDKDGKPKTYGGALKKVRNAAKEHPVIQKILEELKDLQED